jgi:hypothetical protein
MRSLSKSPKVAMNSLKNVSKLFKSDACHSSNDTNQARIMHDNKALMSPTWVGPFG